MSNEQTPKLKTHRIGAGHYEVTCNGHRWNVERRLPHPDYGTQPVWYAYEIDVHLMAMMVLDPIETLRETKRQIELASTQ